MSSSPNALIAVNCHVFHDTRRIEAGLVGLKPAIDAFRSRYAGAVRGVLFWHGPTPPTPRIRDLARRATLEIRQMRHATNGENLNAQIAHALDSGFGLFFRVDGDDMVDPARFFPQAQLLNSGDCDLCGAGLDYAAQGRPRFRTQPAQRPVARDFVENQFVLHPTMAFRLDAIQSAGLRYRRGRLEDKEFLLNAARAGLKIRNLPYSAGTYFLSPLTRSSARLRLRGFALNLRFLLASGALHLVPYATALLLASLIVGPQKLREIRGLKPRPRPRRSRLKTASDLNQC